MTESELKTRLTEIPQRNWEALIFAIEDQIYGIELFADAKAASNQGIISHLAGGIYYLRALIDELDKNRILKQ